MWLDDWVNCPIVRAQAKETSRAGPVPRLQLGPQKQLSQHALGGVHERGSPGDCMCS